MISSTLFPAKSSFFLNNPFQLHEFRVFRPPRFKIHHRHHRIRCNLNPFETLFDSMVSQLTSIHSLQLIAPALGFSSGVALYLSNRASANNSMVSGQWVLLTSPTPFNRFVFLRCPSISFPGTDFVDEKLVKEGRHFVRLHSGRINATFGNDGNCLEENLMYQRLCISTEDGGVISLDWPSNLNLKEEHGLDTTLLLVPGTPEGSMAKNIQFSVIEALTRGFFPIVMNPRGCAGSPLTTARLFTAADSDDIGTAVQFINKARPWTSLMAIGWGYGANMLTKYLAESGERTPLTAATCIDNPFDLEEATQTHPYNTAIDQNLTGGLISILRSNKELFQGKTKGFDVEKAFKAKSVRDFDRLISSVSHGFNSVEDFYSKSSTRSVVGNVKIPVLYIQNDNGSAPIFSIPRSLIAENPFTSLLLCSYLPSAVISGVQPDLPWCQQLAIEWLTAVELGLLKGRHPLLKDVDITINPSKGLVLMEGRAADKRGKVHRHLDYTRSNVFTEYSANFVKDTLEESDGATSTYLRSRNDLQRKSFVNSGSQEMEVGILQRTSSIKAEMVKEGEKNAEDIEKGQVLRTAEVIMNMLDITNPGTLTEEEKKKVLNAVDKGETLMKALQDAVPEEVRGKLTAAVSEILHAEGSNLKMKDLLGASQIPNASFVLKKKIEKNAKHMPTAEESTQVSSSSHQMRDANDVTDDSDSYQTVMDKSSGEPKPPSSVKVQSSVDQDDSQPVSIHGNDAIDSIRKETSDLGNPDQNNELSRENSAQYIDNDEKEPDTGSEPQLSSKAEQIGCNDVEVGENNKGQGGGIAQLDENGDDKPPKNEEKVIDSPKNEEKVIDSPKNEEKVIDSPNDHNKVVSSFKTEEVLSLQSNSEDLPLEQEYNDDQKDDKNVQPVLDHTKSTISESKVNGFNVSQALDALAGIDDSTQVAVNSVFNVIENMISQLEGSENESEDKNTHSSSNNHSLHNDQLLEKKEHDNIDSNIKSERLSGPHINDSLEVRMDSNQDVASGSAKEEFTQNPVSINGSLLVCSQLAAQGKNRNEKDGLVNQKFLVEDLENKMPPYITSNMYLDYVHNSSFLKYLVSNMPTKSLDTDTTSALLLDYIPEEGQWKFIEQPGNENDAISTREGVDRQVQAYSHAKVKNTDDVIEPPYVILDNNQPDPVWEYITSVNGKEEIEGNGRSEDLVSFVKTIILDSLLIEVSRRLSVSNKMDLQSGVNRDLEHVANELSLAVWHNIKHRQHLKCKNSSVDFTADKMGTLCGEQIIRSISSAVQETIYLKEVLPVGVIVGSSLAALRNFFYVTTMHDDDQGECSTLDQAQTSLQITHGEVNGGEPSQKVTLNDTVCREGEDTEIRNLNKGTVMVGAVTAALGASALLVHQQNSCHADQTTESSFKSKEKDNIQKESERLVETIPEKNHNIVTTLAEKAMSVASPVVPMKEDGEVDQERLVAMLADLGQKGGMLRLVGKIALLWGGLRSAMSLTDRLISFLRIAERPLLQRILGFVGMVVVLWSPIFLPLLPALVNSWTTNTTSAIANFACILGLYTAITILVMLWGKRIRGYENPLKEYGLDLTCVPKICNFLMGFLGGVALVLGVQSANRFLGHTSLMWPVIPSPINMVSWLKVYGGFLLFVGQGIIRATIVIAVEELLFRSWLTEEIASDLGYYPGIIISGLAFAISQRCVETIPALWVLSLGLAGARQRSEGSLSIPIGIRAGMAASTMVLRKGGFIISSIPSKYSSSIWMNAFEPLSGSGVAGFAFCLLVASIFFPINPSPSNTLKRTIRH